VSGVGFQVSGAELGTTGSGLGIRARGGYEKLVGSGLLPTAFCLLLSAYCPAFNTYDLPD